MVKLIVACEVVRLLTLSRVLEMEVEGERGKEGGEGGMGVE